MAIRPSYSAMGPVRSVAGRAGGRPAEPGLLGLRLHADGAQHGLITIPAGGSRRPTTPETVEAKSHTLRMQGAPLFRLAVKRLEQVIREIVKEFGVEVQDVAQLVLHQANGRILAQLTKRLGVSQERVCSVIGRYGNTSSASLPIALDHVVRSGRILPHDIVLLGSFGGGVTWAAGSGSLVRPVLFIWFIWFNQTNETNQIN